MAVDTVDTLELEIQASSELATKDIGKLTASLANFGDTVRKYLGDMTSLSNVLDKIVNATTAVGQTKSVKGLQTAIKTAAMAASAAKQTVRVPSGSSKEWQPIIPPVRGSSTVGGKTRLVNWKGMGVRRLDFTSDEIARGLNKDLGGTLMTNPQLSAAIGQIRTQLINGAYPEKELIELAQELAGHAGQHVKHPEILKLEKYAEAYGGGLPKYMEISKEELAKSDFTSLKAANDYLREHGASFRAAYPESGRALGDTDQTFGKRWETIFGDLQSAYNFREKFGMENLKASDYHELVGAIVARIIDESSKSSPVDTEGTRAAAAMDAKVNAERIKQEAEDAKRIAAEEEKAWKQYDTAEAKANREYSREHKLNWKEVEWNKRDEARAAAAEAGQDRTAQEIAAWKEADDKAYEAHREMIEAGWKQAAEEIVRDQTIGGNSDIKSVIENATGVGRAMMNAEENSTALQAREMQDWAEAITKLATVQPGTGLQEMIDKLTGVNLAAKSAKDSAFAFMKAFGDTHANGTIMNEKGVYEDYDQFKARMEAVASMAKQLPAISNAEFLRDQQKFLNTNMGIEREDLLHKYEPYGIGASALGNATSFDDAISKSEEFYQNVEKIKAAVQDLFTQLNTPVSINWADSIDRMMGIKSEVKSAEESMNAFLQGMGGDSATAQQVTALNPELNALAEEARAAGISSSELTTELINLDGELKLKKKDTSAAKAGFADLRNEQKEAEASSNKLRGAIDNLGKHIGHGLLGQLARVAKMRALRYIIKSIVSGIKEGITNLYQWSKIVNGDFVGTMDTAKSKIMLLKNSFATALAPVIQALVPILSQVVSWINTACNAISQFFALLTGKNTWTKALETAETWGDKTKKSANNAKEAVKDLLADWDELNIIQQENDNSGSSGSGKTNPDYASMFEEVSVFDEWTKDFDKIKEIVTAIGYGIAAWFVINEVQKFLDMLGLAGDKVSSIFTRIKKGVVGAVLLKISFELAEMAGEEIAENGLTAKGILEASGAAMAAAIGGKFVAEAILGPGSGVIGAISGLVITAFIGLNAYIEKSRELTYAKMAQNSFAKTGKYGFNTEKYKEEVEKELNKRIGDLSVSINTFSGFEKATNDLNNAKLALSGLGTYVYGNKAMTAEQANEFKNNWEIIFNAVKSLHDTTWSTINIGIAEAMKNETEENKKYLTVLQQQMIELQRLTGGAQGAWREEVRQISGRISSGKATQEDIDRYNILLGLIGDSDVSSSLADMGKWVEKVKGFDFGEGPEAIQNAVTFIDEMDTVYTKATDEVEEWGETQQEAISSAMKELQAYKDAGFIDEKDYKNGIDLLNKWSAQVTEKVKKDLGEIDKLKQETYGTIFGQVQRGYAINETKGGSGTQYIEEVTPILDRLQANGFKIPDEMQWMVTKLDAVEGFFANLWDWLGGKDRMSGMKIDAKYAEGTGYENVFYTEPPEGWAKVDGKYIPIIGNPEPAELDVKRGETEDGIQYKDGYYKPITADPKAVIMSLQNDVVPEGVWYDETKGAYTYRTTDGKTVTIPMSPIGDSTLTQTGDGNAWTVNTKDADPVAVLIAEQSEMPGFLTGTENGITYIVTDTDPITAQLDTGSTPDGMYDDGDGLTYKTQAADPVLVGFETDKNPEGFWYDDESDAFFPIVNNGETKLLAEVIGDDTMELTADGTAWGIKTEAATIPVGLVVDSWDLDASTLETVGNIKDAFNENINDNVGEGQTYEEYLNSKKTDELIDLYDEMIRHLKYEDGGDQIEFRLFSKEQKEQFATLERILNERTGGEVAGTKYEDIQNKLNELLDFSYVEERTGKELDKYFEELQPDVLEDIYKEINDVLVTFNGYGEKAMSEEQHWIMKVLIDALEHNGSGMVVDADESGMATDAAMNNLTGAVNMDMDRLEQVMQFANTLLRAIADNTLNTANKEPTIVLNPTTAMGRLAGAARNRVNMVTGESG